jgi:hypothetical protein
MRTRTVDNERGMALAVSLFCLVVIGAMVAGNFFSGRLEQQSGRNMFYVAEASEAAEAALADALETVAPEALETIPMGGSPMVLSTMSLGPGVSSNREISRLTATLFLIRARGVRADVAGEALASRAVGALVHVIPGSTSQEAGPAMVIERGWIQLY